MNRQKLIVGWQEWVGLPKLGIPAVRAKIDTGAKTSSLHAYRIEKFTQNGESYVRFQIHPVQRNRNIVLLCEAPLIDKRTVKSSSGEKEQRPVIKTRMTLGHESWDIELNLTNRDYMGFRMLIGREAMEQLLLINPGATYLHGKITQTKVKQLYGAGENI